MVDLLLDEGGGIRSLPHRWVLSTSRNGEYFHLARSAEYFPGFNGRARRLVVSTWCGPSFSDPILTDQPQGPMCGTCTGRWLGVGDAGFAFRPRSLRSLPKRWCQGSRQRWAVHIRGTRLSRCLACGQVVRWHGAGLRQHEHNGRGIACPEHGTKWLHMSNPYEPSRPQRMICVGHPRELGSYRCQLTPRPFWLIPSHEGGRTR